MAGTSLRKRITLNDVVGSFSDEFSFLYEAGLSKLTSNGIILEADIKDNKVRVLNMGSTEKTREFYQIIFHSLSIIEADKSIYNQLKFKTHFFKPIVLASEEIKVSIIVDGKEIKTIYLPMDSKEFNKKNIQQALVIPSLFSNQSVNKDLTFQIKITLSKISPIRELMKAYFYKLGEKLILDMVQNHRAELAGRSSGRSYSSVGIIFEDLKMSNLDEAKFFRPRSVFTLGYLISEGLLNFHVSYPMNNEAEVSLIPTVEPEKILGILEEQNWTTKVSQIRDMIMKIEEGKPLNV